MKKNFTKVIIFFISSIFIFVSVGEMGIRLRGWKEPPIIYQEISDPDLKWVHTSNYEGIFFLTYVKINSQGLRDREYTYEKPKDTFRIFTVGECSTFGHSAYLQESFAKQLERLLNKTAPFGKFTRYEVINGGLVQYDDLQKLAFLKKHGLKYNPDLIIFSHDIDFKPWIDIKERTWLFKKIGSKIPKNIHFLRYIYRKLAEILPSYLEQKLLQQKGGYINYVKWRYRETGPYLIKTKEALQELAKLSKDRNIPIVITLLPWPDHFEEDRYPFKGIHNFFYNECGKNSLPFLDFYKDFFRNKNPDMFTMKVGFPPHLRFNPYAHRIMAEEIFRFMVSSSKVDLTKIK